MNNMNKEDIVPMLAHYAKVTQVDAKKILNSMMETIELTVANGEKVTLQGFGVFKHQHRAARTARNINENKVIQLPATTIPVFIPSKIFKERVENYVPEPLFGWRKMP